jgi:hypothetical protein
MKIADDFGSAAFGTLCALILMYISEHAWPLAEGMVSSFVKISSNSH